MQPFRRTPRRGRSDRDSGADEISADAALAEVFTFKEIQPHSRFFLGEKHVFAFLMLQGSDTSLLSPLASVRQP